MPAITSFESANQYLTRFYRNAQAEYTLDNIRKLMDYLGNPQNKFRAVHVAGTSGKTSTAYYIAAMLTLAGKKTGLTVSPHVDEINERVQINGQSLPEAEFCAALTEFLDLIENAPAKPSWFEAMVAFAYWHFAKQEVDYAVIEVGLGGLKDGTNIITRPDKVCIITDIGLDHVEVLGTNLRDIATQKIGIVQNGNSVFSYQQSEEVMNAFKAWTEEHNATLNVIPAVPNDSSMPDYQHRNWALAEGAYSYLRQRDSLPPLAGETLKTSQNIQIPGRMDIRQLNDKIVIMDGAHNVQKMTAFVTSFQRLSPGVKPAVLVSFKEDKDYEMVVPLLETIAERVIATTFNASQDVPAKSIDPSVLAAAFRQVPAVSIPNQKEALQALLNGPEPIVIITGSFYLLAEVRKILGLT